jgi:hypothetical protein
MLNLLKLFSLAFIIYSSLHLNEAPFTALIVVSLLVLLLIKSELTPLSLFRRNIFIFSFTVLFSLISLLSQHITGGIESHSIIFIAVKTVLIFNIILLGGIWIGRNGFLFFLNLCPSMRLKIYLLLLYNTVTGFMKRNRVLLYQLKSRISLTGKNFFMFIRYYLVNLISIDLYSIHLNQGALLSRIHGSFTVYHQRSRLNLIDSFIVLLAFGSAVYTIMVVHKIIPGA